MKNKNMRTIDNKTYYDRIDYSIKIKTVDNIVNNLNGVNNILDCGCNNGDVSYPLQKKYNKIVRGIDLSSDLKPPKDYNFTKGDIVKINHNLISDCTIFLSLYHHILGKYGLDVADDVFYKLLFNSKYLIFDTGNLSENSRNNTYWFKEQNKHFKNEEELLNHFGVKYEKCGSYNVGNGTRNIVLFKNDATINFGVINKFKRKKGSKHQNEGLFDINTKGNDFYANTIFTKLRLGNKIMYGKKVIPPTRHNMEIKNINLVYKHIDSDKLLKFYGYHETYGFLFEWVDNFKYIGTTELIVGDDIKLIDVDIIEVDGIKKYIDFER